VSSRELKPTDAQSIREVVAAARKSGAPHAFPGLDDVASLLADGEEALQGRIWAGGGSTAAWCLAQPELGNLLFDLHPNSRADALEDEVVGWGLEALQLRDRPTADTPLESDDAWRAAVLRRWAFQDSGEDVVHLRTRLTGQLPPIQLPEGWRVRPLGADIDAYVRLHRAAFGTTYLTKERRAAWHEQPGYQPELDLVLTDASGNLVGFCVCWAPGDSAELGTIGVLPEHRGRGFGRQIAREALHKLAERGLRDVTMSTSSANAAMLAVAAAEGFVEQRRTHWLHRATTTSTGEVSSPDQAGDLRTGSG
jgi:RimJ/RimL family protein N-acetyltransferase